MGSSPAINMMNELARIQAGVRTAVGMLRKPGYDERQVITTISAAMDTARTLEAKYYRPLRDSIGADKLRPIDSLQMNLTSDLIEVYMDDVRSGIDPDKTGQIAGKLQGTVVKIQQCMNLLEDAEYGTGKSAKAVVAAAKANGVKRVERGVSARILVPDIERLINMIPHASTEQHVERLLGEITQLREKTGTISDQFMIEYIQSALVGIRINLNHAWELIRNGGGTSSSRYLIASVNRLARLNREIMNATI